jgi:hypothetical protein
MVQPGPAYPTWADVLRARRAYEDAESEFEAELTRFAMRSTSEGAQREWEAKRRRIEWLGQRYQDERDLYFAGEQSRHDGAILAGAMKAEKLAETNKKLNFWVTGFVVVSAVGTVAQAIAAWAR